MPSACTRKPPTPSAKRPRRTRRPLARCVSPRDALAVLIPAVDRHPDADDEEEPERVDGELVGEIEVADPERLARERR